MEIGCKSNVFHFSIYTVKHSNTSGVKRILNAPINRRHISFSVAMLLEELIGDIVCAIDGRGRVFTVVADSECD